MFKEPLLPQKSKPVPAHPGRCDLHHRRDAHEGANTGKIVLLVILGAAFIVWHVECQRLINRNRGDEETGLHP